MILQRPSRAVLLTAAALLLASSVQAAAPPDAAAVRDAVRAWRRAHARPLVEEFTRLLAVPNHAGDRDGLARNARLITILLKKRGFDVHVLATNKGGAPAVFGELRAPGATRTVMIYAHYDGQPVDPKQWHGDPYVPVLRDGRLEDGARERTLDELEAAGDAAGEWRLYGRSTSDDKAPVIGVLGALDALRAAGIAPAVNLKVLFEGEEESGSPELETILRGRLDLLRADLWLLCDGPVHQSRRMQLFFGARGIVDVELTVYGPARALHSGHYGNWAPNPAIDLARLVASMRDRDGRVTIDGFADAVRPPSDAERRALAGVPDADEGLRAELALHESEAGNARLVERVMLPALNLRGLEAGRVGALAANAIPTTARASIDFRLVPNQTPEGVRAAVEAHLARQGFHVVQDEPGPELRRAHPRIVRAEWGTGYPAARTDMDLPLAREVRRIVDEAVGGSLVVMPTLGGSIPMHLFAEVTGVPVIGVPVANHDNNQHAADENLRLQNLWDALEVYAALIARLGAPGAP